MASLNTTTSCPFPVENPYILNISTSYGSGLLGSFLSCAMWGASSLQTFIYYVNREDDPVWMKFLIATLWTFDTVNEILILKSNWKVLVLQYGRIAGLYDIMPELMHHTWIEAVVVFAVQMYFIRRIYLFAKSPTARSWSTTMIIFLACLESWVSLLLSFILTFEYIQVLLASWQLVGIVVYQIFGYGRNLAYLSTKREVGINLSLRAAAVAVDVATAICMVYLLTRRGPARFTRSKRMVRRLLVIVVSSGSLTALLVTIVLILLAKYPNTMYYCMFEYMLCSLYFSTLLANLNARDFITDENCGVNTFSDLSASTFGGPNTRDLGKQSKSTTLPSEVSIKVQKDWKVTTDNVDGFGLPSVPSSVHFDMKP